MRTLPFQPSPAMGMELVGRKAAIDSPPPTRAIGYHLVEDERPNGFILVNGTWMHFTQVSSFNPPLEKH